MIPGECSGETSCYVVGRPPFRSVVPQGADELALRHLRAPLDPHLPCLPQQLLLRALVVVAGAAAALPDLRAAGAGGLVRDPGGLLRAHPLPAECLVLV